MTQMFNFKLALICALSLVASGAPLMADPPADPVCSGSLVRDFNCGGPKKGVQTIPMSPFLNIAEGIGLQHTGNTYKIVVNGDAVQKPNLHEPGVTPPFVVDGFVDERGWALTRLNSDGDVDLTFGPNGNGKVYLEVGSIACVTAQHGLAIGKHNEIIYIGSNQLAASQSYGPPVDGLTPPGLIGISTPFLPLANCGFQPLKDPLSGNFYSTTQIAVGRFKENGSIDTSFTCPGTGVFLLPPVFGLNSLGDSSNAGILDHKERIVVVGLSSPDAKGCIFKFPLILRLTKKGILDTSFNGTGIVVEGTVGGTNAPDTTPYTDNTVSPSVNLGYSQFEAVAIHSNKTSLKGRIVAVGDGDVNGQTWPTSARVIASRYKDDGSLDTSFGVNGYLVISAQSNSIPKQLLVRAVAIDDKDNIYLGGDIANNGSGPPGSTTIPTTAVTELMARPTANFLIIKLNKKGIPQNFGAKPGCTACQTTVFQNCNTCQLQWNDGVTTHSFTALTTDFKGFDDAVFQLIIDNKKGLLTAIGQAGLDAPLDSLNVGVARYKLHDGSLDNKFGTSGQVMISGPKNLRTLARNALVAPNGTLLMAGQSGAVPEVTTPPNFEDSIEKDVALFNIHQ